MKQLFIFLIRFYQHYIRWALVRTCRFHPSCSEYCLEAIKRYGVIIGLWKGTKRILRCNPFSSVGYDPLEPRKVN